MKRFLIALNLIIWSAIAVNANASTQLTDWKLNPLYLYSTKDMGSNTVRATYGVKWKDGTMTYSNVEFVCGETKARDIGYSDDGTGTVWKDHSKDLYNGKKYYDLAGDGKDGSIKYTVYRTVCKDQVAVEDKKQKDFASTRAAYGYLLTAAIKKSAFDPDALKIESPQYYKNGVCVSANGKNRFGAYTGFKEYCYLVDNKGQWKLHEPA